MPVASMEKEAASTELVETQGGSLYSTEAPPGPASNRTQSSIPQRKPCPAAQLCPLRPLADVGVRGQLNPHSFPGTALRVRVGEHSREMRGYKDRDLTPPGPGSAPAEGPAEGPACPRAAPPPPCLCVRRGAEEELAESFGLKTHLFAASRARRQGPLCAARGSARGRHTKAAAPLGSAPLQVSAAPAPRWAPAPAPGPRTAMGAPGPAVASPGRRRRPG